MSTEKEIFIDWDAEAIDNSAEEAAWETKRVEAQRELNHYMIELAGGIADTPLVGKALAECKKIYREQILDNWTPDTAIRAVSGLINVDRNFTMSPRQVAKLMRLYFRSIGFNADIWVDSIYPAWERVEL